VILAVSADTSAIAGALAHWGESFAYQKATTAREAISRARTQRPALVVIGGDPSDAACTLELLAGQPSMAGASFVAWPKDARGEQVARLSALGARVALASSESLRHACEEAWEDQWVHAEEARTHAAKEQEALAQAVELPGKRVLVADDDPAALWFFADVLRSAGCDVAESSDGEEALDTARRLVPDAVLTDIRMPRLDGVRLCEALRADPVLADVPVVLLSWKEDWLSDASRSTHAVGRLTKRATPEEVLRCVRAALSAHARLERGLRQAGPARGVLDAVAPYRLLRAVCDARRDARVTLRDAAHLYEIRIRDGAPRAAVRLATDGSVLRGEEALGASLSLRGGRFSVVAERSPVEDELRGTLHEQIAPHIAIARGYPAARPESQQTIPMELPADVEAPSGFDLPRATPTLLELPVRTARLAFPRQPRPAAPESTLRIVFPTLSGEPPPKPAVHGPSVARTGRRRESPPARVSSWARALGRAVLATVVIVGLAVTGAVASSDDGHPAGHAPLASSNSSREAGGTVPDSQAMLAPGARASRTVPARSR